MKCSYVLKSDKHSINGLADILSGKVIDDAVVNVRNSAEIGTTQWLDYERGQLNFIKLTKQVRHQQSRLLNLQIIDTEYIYAHVIGIMAIVQRNCFIETLFSL